ncbi:MAG: Rrf2 family transcriptional regulator [Algoriphagus sp.]|jgi:Rrf2 family protein|uniref:RrF2 family transcriptional regulator n=1 Tax=Algoriphagus sp. TaxID=1872435 RepID=UPI0027284186|nr:Rrf2 family transcriptional regulator [Algoriphagus sp.]MDO8966088.1 Rrf2 family transcriptional regulator [Algoriphagus sp.]MDP2043510.1 Rrf2 family transcriptional regulator [Algoriphagus sp.]MDP3199235.1 Rrf2 family transcriptional regulator [Algoriphagus sp.]MDP3472442.1 Rrf2 family transcriptional regulator [Algoriphagus sp.]
MFSKACEYGIKAMIYVGTQSLKGERVKIGEIVENVGSPEAFTAKILSDLVKNGLIESLKGPYGGFYIPSDQMESIKVIHIVSVIDGDAIFSGCGLGLRECNAQEPCPMHTKFVKIRSELKQALASTSLLELANGIKSGKTILVR